MTQPILSIIMGTWQRLAYLKECVESARRSLPGGWVGGQDFEVVIVDGGSTDGTIEWCQSQPDIVLIQHGELKGAIKAFNDAGKAAKGKFLLLSNDDIEFVGKTIAAGLGYILDRPDLGAACFYQDRGGKDWHVEHLEAVNELGQKVYVPYVQVGIVPKWLWDYCGGWGDFGARTYGGDCYLSAKIMEAGYKIEAVPGTKIHDRTPNDELRRVNCELHDAGADGQNYYKAYPDGVKWALKPIVENPLPREKKILLATIYEPGHEVQKQQKNGLREAFKKVGVVWEVDHIGNEESVSEAAELWHPFFSFLQLHCEKHISEAGIEAVRANSDYVMSWSGDVWDTQATPKYLQMARNFDLHGTINKTLIPKFESVGVPCAYVQNSFENAIVGEDRNADIADILFQGNNYSEYRTNLVRELLKIGKDLQCAVRVLGRGYPEDLKVSGESLYDFAKIGHEIRSARIVIGDNQFYDAIGFCSDRLFMSMAAGGALLLHQRVAEFEQLTGFKDGVHYIVWDTLADLKEKVAYYLKHEDERQKIANAGTDFCRKYHNFNVRVQQIIEKIANLPKKKFDISTMIICRNEEKNIEKCIRQAQEFSKEIIVLDTGSIDTTERIVHDMAEKDPRIQLYKYKWENDFSKARNIAKSFCTKPWIFWMDCDDEIEAKTLNVLKQFDKWDFTRFGVSKFHAVDFKIVDKYSGQSCFHTRLFANIPKIKWESPVHESLGNSLAEIGIEPVGVGKIYHMGNMDEKARMRKNLRNLAILNTVDDTPWKLHYVGISLMSMEKYPDAILVFQWMLEQWESKLDKCHVDEIYFNMGMSYKFAGYLEFSRKMLEKSGKKDAFFLLAFMNEDRKIEYLEKYLKVDRDKEFGSFADAWTAEAVAKLKTYYQEKLTALEKHGS